MVKSACGIEAVYMCFNGTGIWGGETIFTHLIRSIKHPENMRRWPTVGLLLPRCLRLRLNSKTPLGQRLMFAEQGHNISNAD